MLDLSSQATVLREPSQRPERVKSPHQALSSMGEETALDRTGDKTAKKANKTNVFVVIFFILEL